jgi:hypothetical protein
MEIKPLDVKKMEKEAAKANAILKEQGFKIENKNIQNLSYFNENQQIRLEK